MLSPRPYIIYNIPFKYECVDKDPESVPGVVSHIIVMVCFLLLINNDAEKEYTCVVCTR